jgi:acyl dehydratase
LKIADLKPGLELGASDWLVVTQEQIDQFADLTGDDAAIHVDTERAAQGPFGSTIAHGLLTLSLQVKPWGELMQLEDKRLGLNYGLNRVRFPAPVPVGSRIRSSYRVVDVTDVDGGVQVTVAATTERQGSEKPVCVFEIVARFYR